MLQLRGKTGSPHKGDGTLSQSSEETFEAVLARLKTNRCVCKCDKPGSCMLYVHSLASSASLHENAALCRGLRILAGWLADLICMHTPLGNAASDSACSEVRHCCRRNLEVWTEHFRLWLAAEVLQPLDRLVRRAQKVGGSP